MKQIKFFLHLLTAILILNSCTNHTRKIVDEKFVDSLITHYTEPPAVKSNREEIEFWKNRIDPKKPGLVSESKYAAALSQRFRLTGDVHDMITSDSVLKNVTQNFDNKESSPILALVAHSITQHKFIQADSSLKLAKAIGIKPYESTATSFDVDFELGRYLLAETELKNIKQSNDFGYYFRYSKLAHYKGELDTAVFAMLKAAQSTNDIYFKQAALSNAADLYMHSGDLQKAYDLYLQSIYLNAADLHSIMGVGWISLMYDKDFLLAEKVFRFVQAKTKSPEPIFKLVSVAEAKGDSALVRKYAYEFIKQASDPVNGNMYNKYLVQLYTGILNEPAKAEALSKKELENRATPQTCAWYVWSLYSNNKKQEAYNTYEKFVSGKPLEGLELYWMGKLMQGLNKGYNAQQFFKAADKNKYDLTPAEIKDLENSLAE